MATASTSAQADTDTTLSNTILNLPNGISIRTYRTADAAPIAHHANNRTLWCNMRDLFPSPYTLDDAHDWIAMQLDPAKTWRTTSPPWPSPSSIDSANATTTTTTTTTTKLPTNYVIALDGAAIGGIGLKFGTDIESRTLELGYWVGEEHWGKGIASTAVKAFLDWTFAAFPYIVRVYAQIFHWNKGSMRVVEKSGMVKESVMTAALFKEGKLGDLVCYVRIREGLEY